MAQTFFEKNGVVGDYQDGVDFLNALAAEGTVNPYRVAAFGRSVQGRTIYGAILGADPSTAEDVVLLTTSIHSGETSCRESGLQYVRELANTTDAGKQAYLTTVCWIIIPTTQADTYGQHEKTNANGVDINQDMLALSQPESRAIRGVAKRYPRLDMLIDSHEGAMDKDYSVAVPTVKYGVHPDVQSVSDSLCTFVLDELTTNGVDPRQWDAWDTTARYRNAIASEWDIPTILLETAVNDPIATRVVRTLVAFEATRVHHATNRQSYRSAKIASEARAISPALITTAAAN